MDLNQLIGRVQKILLEPKTEWQVIEQEPASVSDLYKNYILVLAAVPAVLQFLQLSVIGVSVPLAGRIRIGMGAGLTSMVLRYVLSLVTVYVMALIVDALAPTFQGQRNPTQALKTVAYAYTASWVAGIGLLVPWLGVLILLAGVLYSIYLLYLGLPVTTKCPPDKAVGYTAVAIVIAFVLSLVVSTVVGGVVGVGALAGSSIFSSISSDAKFDKDSTLGQLQQYADNMEKASKKLEAAQKSGDAPATQEALADAVGAVFGGGKVEALALEQLQSFVPESLRGRPRITIQMRRNRAMGVQTSEANASFRNESGQTINLEIIDLGGAKGLMGLANVVGAEEERQTDSGYEKTFRDNGRLVTEKWDNSSSHGEYSVVVGDRFTVKVAGDADGIEELRSAVAELDLAQLERLKDAGVGKPQ